MRPIIITGHLLTRIRASTAIGLIGPKNVFRFTPTWLRPYRIGEGLRCRYFESTRSEGRGQQPENNHPVQEKRRELIRRLAGLKSCQAVLSQSNTPNQYQFRLLSAQSPFCSQSLNLNKRKYYQSNLSIFCCPDLLLSLLGVRLHLLPPLLPPLLHLLLWVEQLLLVDLEQVTPIFLDVPEDLIGILWVCLLQFFQLLLQLPILAHSDLIDHVEVALVMGHVAHEGSNATLGTFSKILIGGNHL